MSKDFEREELQEIRDRAIRITKTVGNDHWRQALKQLAGAADRLDAMIARTEDKEDCDSPVQEGYK